MHNRVLQGVLGVTTLSGNRASFGPPGERVPGARWSASASPAGGRMTLCRHGKRPDEQTRPIRMEPLRERRLGTGAQPRCAHGDHGSRPVRRRHAPTRMERDARSGDTSEGHMAPAERAQSRRPGRGADAKPFASMCTETTSPGRGTSPAYRDRLSPIWPSGSWDSGRPRRGGSEAKLSISCS